jgi:hypothetical protein
MSIGRGQVLPAWAPDARSVDHARHCPRKDADAKDKRRRDDSVAWGSLPMFARLIAAGIAATLSLAAPALAVTPKEKQATCEFGANDQKLTGAKRKAFIARCMASEDRPARAKKSKPKS